MTLRRSSVLALLVLAVASAALIARGVAPPGRAPTAAQPGVSDALARAAREPEPELVGPEARHGAARSAEVTLESSRDAATRAGDAVESGDVLLLRVLEAESEAPLPAAQVELRPAGERPYHGVTDERGELQLALDEVPARLGQRLNARIRDQQGLERWRGALEVEREVVLRLAAILVLRGEVVLDSGESPRGLTVSVWSPPRGAETVEQFVGHDELGDDGRFAIAAPSLDAPALFTLRIGGVGLPVCVRVPTAELVAPAGVRLVVALARLTVGVTDETGVPVVRATVRCASPASTDGAQPLVAEASTGEDGRARFLTPVTPLAITAGAGGHAPASARVSAGDLGAPVQLVLRRLNADDRVSGRVEFEDGTPVEAALVTGWASAAEGELSVPSMVQARTDAAGRFELQLATDRELTLFAFHKSHGESAAVPWRGGDGEARLVIVRGGTVIVDAPRAPRAPVVISTSYTVALHDAAGRIEIVEASSFPVVFERVPPGVWTVVAVAEPLGASAEASVGVGAGSTARIDLEFESPAPIVGRVTPAPDPGRGLEVRFLPDGWPAEAARALLRASVREDGTFVLSARGSGTVELIEGRQTIERRPARSGTPLVLTLLD
ncbi:MAG: carboxypeptidase regulatory-like domain-containing protein [Planctomycetes bacterium]|nr:carboxypeptidase regulatory-like domain-containing protein [Planctomycetota bacterium]